METEEEQHITTLLCMGFPDPDVIRKALRLAKNDINEAVALLTNESPGLGYGYEPMESGPAPGVGSTGDVESGGSSSGTGGGGGRTGTTGGFDPPPAYHDVVDSEVKKKERGFPTEHQWRERNEGGGQDDLPGNTEGRAPVNSAKVSGLATPQRATTRDVSPVPRDKGTLSSDNCP